MKTILLILLTVAVLLTLGLSARAEEECIAKGGVYQYRVGCVDRDILIP